MRRGLSERQACRLMGIGRSSRRYEPRPVAFVAGRDTYVSGTICSLSGGMLTNKMARLKGFEPPTSSSGGKRSIH